MRPINNIWVSQKRFEIEALKRQLLEYDYAGSYGGAIDLMKVNNIIDGAIVEILKIQSENDILKEQLNKYIAKEKLAKEENEKTDAE